VTVTATVTPTWPAHGGFYYRPSQCKNCQMITYTDAASSIVTIAVPPTPYATGSASTVTFTPSAVSDIKFAHPIGKHW